MPTGAKLKGGMGGGDSPPKQKVLVSPLFGSIEEQETIENAAQRAVTEEELIVQDTRISRLETRDVEETIEDTSVGNSDEEVACLRQAIYMYFIYSILCFNYFPVTVYYYFTCRF